MIVYQPLILSGGSSKDMTVNGSVTPKVFLYTADADYRLIKLHFAMLDEGTTSANKFGAITALTNGVLIETVIGGVSKTIANLIDNADLCTHFRQPYFGSGAVLSIVGVSTPQGFLNTNNAFIGEMDFNTHPFTHLASGDKIQATVRDGLGNIDGMRMTAVLGYE